jgi:NADH:ubiquinone oxidoreductase subunit 5 (subunit L)/multisubunit Na+/H+ antiporter MnhA subunit
MILFTIYLIGFIISYLIIKLKLRKKNDEDWLLIILTTIISLFSFIFIIIYLFEIFRNKFKNTKPPKWL